MGKDNLGEFELLVLLACLRLGEAEAYAVSIVDEIRARTGRDLHRAAVYVTLQRLEAKGLIATHLGEPRAERGGKARRHVWVTAGGRAAAQGARQAFQRMWVGLGPQLGDR
jgi:PadR family transcriptional regulator